MEGKKRNRHFNTLSMYAYRDFNISALSSEVYFNQHIKNGLILFQEKKLYSNYFPQPKSLIRYRRWIFLSLEMRLLYYALGLNIARRANAFTACANISSRYGGYVHNFQENVIQLDTASVYYKKNYRAFYNEAQTKIKNLELNPDIAELCVIRMDIENFFEHISIKKILKTQNATGNNFKIVPFEQFFSLINHTSKGLPQACNDPVSGYLSWLYLRPFDEALAAFIKQEISVNDFNIYRYCDDTHVFLHFPKGTQETVIKKIAALVVEFCKKTLWEEYDLRLNNKTIYYHLNNDIQREKYKDSLKSTSQNDDFHIDEDTPHTFSEVYLKFKKALNDYIGLDLLQDPISPNITEDLKWIYDNKFRADLTKLFIQSEPIESGSLLHMVASRADIFTILEKLDYEHLTHMPNVFSFFKKHIPEKFKLLLLENKSDSPAFEWTISSMGLNEYYENESGEYFKLLEETVLFKTQFQKEELIPLEHKEIVDFLLMDYDQNNVAKNRAIEYFSYFSCQRRVSELEEDYNAAVNYLHSECCILLALLDWGFTSNNKKRPFESSYRLKDYKNVDTGNTPSLTELREKRNKTDISHNKKLIPEDLTNSILKDDYYALKENVFKEITQCKFPQAQQSEQKAMEFKV